MKKTIKRNNIKVPAYDGGTPGVGGSSAGNGLTAAQVGAIGQGAITAGSMLANSFLGTSTATTGSLVAAQTAGDIFGGIGKGASIGAAFGPWGAAIGGAAGAVLGAIGLKGREAEMTSFTDYDLGTRPTGLMGAFGANSRLKRERNRIKSNAYANRAAVEGTENLAYGFAQKNKMGGVNSFKDGGLVKKPVYMSSPYDLMGGGQEIATDTKEVGYDKRTGEVKINPAYGKEGSDLIHRIGKPGEYWFGKLINPATGNKFKEDAKKIVKHYHVGGNSAKFQDSRTADENHKNMILDMDELAKAQDRQQKAQNTKPKVKRSVLAGANGMQVPAYEDGVKDFYSLSPEEQQNVRESDPTYKLINWIKNKIKKTPSIKKDYTSKPNIIKLLSEEYINSGLYDPNMELVPGYDIQKTIENFFYNTAKIPTNNEAFVLSNDANTDNKSTSSEILQQLGSTKISPKFRNMILGRNEKPIIGGYHSFDDLGLFNGYWPTFDTSVEVPVEETQIPIVAANVKANTKPTITEEELAANKKAAERPEVKALTEAQHNMILNGLQLGLKTPDLYIPTGINNEPLKKMNIASPLTEEPEKAPKDYSWIGDWAGALASIGANLPGLFAKYEKEKPIHNPYRNAIRNAALDSVLSNLVKLAMIDNTRERAVNNYNVAKLGANTGRNVSLMSQSAVNAANAISKIRLQEDDIRSQRLMNAANIMNNLGLQWVAAEDTARVRNSQNKASMLMTRDTSTKGMLNSIVEMVKQNNLEKRDAQLLPFYQELLKSGFTNDLIKNIKV